MNSKEFNNYCEALSFYNSLDVSYKRMYKESNKYIVKWFEFNNVNIFN